MTFFDRTSSGAPLRLITLCVGAVLLLAGTAPQAEPPGAATVAIAPDVAPALAQAAEDDSVVATDRPARLVSLVDAVDDEAAAAVARDTEARCLAIAVYYESRGEPLEGQLAVAQAIRNRAASGRYPESICGVIDQPGQFRFNRSRAPRAGADWATAQAIAHVAMHDLWPAMAPKAMSFHAARVAPGWDSRTRITQIGRHVFYR